MMMMVITHNNDYNMELNNENHKKTVFLMQQGRMIEIFEYSYYVQQFPARVVCAEHQVDCELFT